MKKLARFLKLCLFFNVTFALSPEYRVVDTNSGQIRGIRESSFLKKVDFYSFRGIPYARAPIGQLRFKVSSNLHLHKFNMKNFNFVF